MSHVLKWLLEERAKIVDSIWKHHIPWYRSRLLRIDELIELERQEEYRRRPRTMKYITLCDNCGVAEVIGIDEIDGNGCMNITSHPDYHDGYYCYKCLKSFGWFDRDGDEVLEP